MPNWKKVVVSGSNAHLNHITGSGNLNIAGTVFFAGDVSIESTGGSLAVKSLNSSDGDADIALISDAGAANEDFWKIKNEGSNNNLEFLNNDNARLTIQHNGTAFFTAGVSGSAFVGKQTIASQTGANNVDLKTSANHNITITGNITLTPTNFSGRRGQSGIITLIQDSSGGHSITLNSLFKTPRGDSISFDTSADGISLMSYYVIDASNVAVNYLGPFS